MDKRVTQYGSGELSLGSVTAQISIRFHDKVFEGYG
jgi:hypothetical protein